MRITSRADCNERLRLVGSPRGGVRRKSHYWPTHRGRRRAASLPFACSRFTSWHNLRASNLGGVVERLMAPVLKTGRAQALVGSNPTPSAACRRHAEIPNPNVQIPNGTLDNWICSCELAAWLDAKRASSFLSSRKLPRLRPRSMGGALRGIRRTVSRNYMSTWAMKTWSRSIRPARRRKSRGAALNSFAT